MRRVDDCHVRTWWEKEVNDEPCADVENTGWSFIPLRMKLTLDVEGRKNERWEIVLGFRIEDSKLPGSMIGEGVVSGVFGIFSSGSVVEVDSALARFCDRSRCLLKSKCSNNGVNGSNR